MTVYVHLSAPVCAQPSPALLPHTMPGKTDSVHHHLLEMVFETATVP